MGDYLIRIQHAWVHVRGHVAKGILMWRDPRDGERGSSLPPNYMEHYPRQLSTKELRRGNGHAAQ